MLLFRSVLALVAALLVPAALSGQERDRWQITLQDGRYLYELRPVALHGDTLVIEQEGRRREIALSDVHELREVRASLQPAGTRQATFPTLTGADDRVFGIGYLDPEEQRTVVAAILDERRSRRSAPSGTPTMWGGS